MNGGKWTREQLENVIKSRNDFIYIFGVEGKQLVDIRNILLARKDCINSRIHVRCHQWHKIIAFGQPVENNYLASEG